MGDILPLAVGKENLVWGRNAQRKNGVSFISFSLAPVCSVTILVLLLSIPCGFFLLVLPIHPSIHPLTAFPIFYIISYTPIESTIIYWLKSPKFVSPALISQDYIQELFLQDIYISISNTNHKLRGKNKLIRLPPNFVFFQQIPSEWKAPQSTWSLTPETQVSPMM